MFCTERKIILSKKLKKAEVQLWLVWMQWISNTVACETLCKNEFQHCPDLPEWIEMIIFILWYICSSYYNETNSVTMVLKFEKTSNYDIF